MIWLDGLDNGLMAQLDTTFFEPGRTGESDNTLAAKSVEGAAREMPAAAGRILRYPYDKARENLGIWNTSTPPMAGRRCRR
jgi:gentisate 1,2-dioxygenase